MDPVAGGLDKLLHVKGFGEGRIKLLTDSVGGGGKLEELLSQGDVVALSSFDRISERTAVDLILAFRGEDPSNLLKTEGSWSVYQSIIEELRDNMNTSFGRNKVSLLIPCGDINIREKEAEEVFNFKELVRGKDRDEITDHLRNIGRSFRGTRPGTRLNYILLVEDETVYNRISELRLDRRCMVVSPEELEPGIEGDMILIYSGRELDETQLPLVGAVHFKSAPERIVPETILEVFGGREQQLISLSRLEQMFEKEGSASRALILLEEFRGLTIDAPGPDRIREVVEEIRTEVESSLKVSIEGLTLSGTDTLSLLSSEEPPALREVYRSHSKKAAELVYEKLGKRKDLYLMGYPLRSDEETLERMISEIEGGAKTERFERKQDIAEKLASLRKDIEEEISWALDLDFKFGLGCFVEDNDLNTFKVVDGWFGIHKACHLMIRARDDRQLVDYHLGEVPGYAGSMFPFRERSGSRTALLTGANSGGKTTLLETLAQVLIMARMGLPVPAERSFIPDIRDLFYYRPKRRLDAGGLEGFLKELLPMVLEVDKGSMVLADELEAMTELEAASRVIGVFVDELGNREAYSVVVTHMAAEIMRFVDCRVDGIEARGLDEGHELIVDRSPVIGKHARSTPELILRKLQARSKGNEKEIYSRVLSHFDG